MVKAESKYDPLDRNFPEVPEGEAGYKEGMDVDDCPYPIQDIRRTAWMTGWYDEKFRNVLGHIWAKYGLEYP